MPVYELLGGKFRDKIRVYADCQVEPGMNFDEIKRVVDDVLERGFTALKIDLDIRAYGHSGSEVAGFDKDRFNTTSGQWEHDRMVGLVEMVTTAAGPSVDVAADVHTRLDVHSAIRLARDLEPFHLLWLEEPVPPENIDAMREVKRATTTPICAGENLYLRHGFRELIEKQAVDIIMPDIPKCGGLSECRKIANLAEIYYMPVRAAQRRLADRHDGLGPCLRHRAELPRPRVPLAAPRLLDDDHHRQGRHHQGRLDHAERPPGHRPRARRDGGAGAPVSGDDLVRVARAGAVHREFGAGARLGAEATADRPARRNGMSRLRYIAVPTVKRATLTPSP